MISARVCVVLYSFRWLLLFCVTLYQNMYSIVCVCVCASMSMAILVLVV